MKALVFTAVNTVELLDVEAPTPSRGEALVHVVASGICGSELDGVRGGGSRIPPLVMGHEFCGVTEDGRRVVVNPLLSCGECDSCRRGATEICRDRRLLGVHRAGGFAERVAVPESALHDLPDGLPWQSAALVEPLANAVHAFGLIGSDLQRIGIVGAGPIGLACLLVGRARGCQVHVADLDEHRRAVASRLGAGRVSDGLVGEFDAVFDAVGAVEAREATVARLRPGGTAVWLGLSTPRADLSTANEVVRWQKRIVGSFGYRAEDFGEALRLAPMLELDWADSFPLTEGAAVFNRLMTGDRHVVKALLRPDHSHGPAAGGLR